MRNEMPCCLSSTILGPILAYLICFFLGIGAVLSSDSPLLGRLPRRFFFTGSFYALVDLFRFSSCQTIGCFCYWLKIAVYRHFDFDENRFLHADDFVFRKCGCIINILSMRILIFATFFSEIFFNRKVTNINYSLTFPAIRYRYIYRSSSYRGLPQIQASFE